MSWFKHKPKPKNPPKLHAHNTSPTTEKLLKETKIEVSKIKSQEFPKNLENKKK